MRKWERIINKVEENIQAKVMEMWKPNMYSQNHFTVYLRYEALRAPKLPHTFRSCVLLRLYSRIGELSGGNGTAMLRSWLVQHEMLTPPPQKMPCGMENGVGKIPIKSLNSLCCSPPCQRFRLIRSLPI